MSESRCVRGLRRPDLGPADLLPQRLPVGRHRTSAGDDFQLAVAGLADAWGGRVRQTMLDPDTARPADGGSDRTDRGARHGDPAGPDPQRVDSSRSRPASACSCCRRRPRPSPASPCCPTEAPAFNEGIDLSDTMRLVSRRDGAARRRHRRPRSPGQGHRAAHRLRAGHAVRCVGHGQHRPAGRQGGRADRDHRRRPTPAASSSSAPPPWAGRASTRAASTRSTSSSASRARRSSSSRDRTTATRSSRRCCPGDGLSIGTDLTVGFSTTQGLYFGGSGGLEINLPAHISLGPVEIQGSDDRRALPRRRHPDRARRHDQGRPLGAHGRRSRTSA